MKAQENVFHPAQSAWKIERTVSGTPKTKQSHQLTYGDTTVTLDRIASCRLRPVKDWDVAGQHFNFMLYVGFAAAFLFLIVEAGWRLQFLAAVVLFFAIAAMSLADVFTTRKIGYFRVEIKTIDGHKHTYATASETDADALLYALAGAGVPIKT